MGVFGSHNHNPRPETDFSKLKTVSVIANFNTEGKFIPVYFRVILPDQSEETYKIESIKSIKESDNRISFRCSYTNNRLQHEVTLTFYEMECRWVMS